MSRSTSSAVVLLALLLAVTLNQRRAGSHERELSLHPDEPTHYVTGLLVREYLRQLAPEPPMPFAERYAVHYPRVGIGHFPPLFYAVEGTWMLVFGASRVSVHLLIAALTAGAGLCLWTLARREWDPGMAWCATLFWLALPLTQFTSITVMADALVVLLCLAALAAYVRFLEAPTGRAGWRAAALFGVFAGLGLLTKGTAVALGLAPLLAVLLTRRWSLLRCGAFWLPTAIVLLLAGPWYVWSQLNIESMGGMIHRATALGRGVGSWERMSYWIVLVGPVVAALAGLAVGSKLWIARSRPLQPFWAVMTAFLASSALLHLYLPESREPRHLFHATPILAIFAVAAVGRLTRPAPRFMASGPAVLALLLLALYPFNKLRWVDKLDQPYGEAAAMLVRDFELEGRAVLISSDGLGEGPFIAEMAMLRPNPETVVMRASRSLAHTGFSGRAYQALYDSPAEIAAMLDATPVAAVVLDDVLSLYNRRHHRELTEALEGSPDRWRLILDDRGVRVFVSALEDTRLRGPVRIEMRRLDKVLELSSPAP